MSKNWLKIGAALLIILLALAVRWSQIDLRPFHADEGVQAYQTAQLLDGKGYHYDPADKHGPFLYYAAASYAKMAGWESSDLRETGLRFVSVLAGLALLALIAFHMESLGPRRSLLGMFFIAIAPMTILYQSYFVQEAWFCFFTWAFLFVVYRYLHDPKLTLALLLGLLAALMHACKETSVIHFAAVGCTLVALGVVNRRHFGSKLLLHAEHAIAAAVVALLVYAAFFSSFGTNTRGLWDGFLCYFNYANKATHPLHNQPWFAYLDIFMPHRQSGVIWGEVLVIGLAVYGSIHAMSKKARTLTQMTVWFTLSLIVLYTIIPYKTPWLLLTPYVGICLLAANGTIEIWNRSHRRHVGWVAIALGVACVVELGWRSYQALWHYPGDERVPYTFQHTSSDFTKIVARVKEEQPEKGKVLRIAVCSPDHAWPLPWYLRDTPSVGYFTSVEQAKGFDLYIVDSRLAYKASEFHQLNLEQSASFGLRPNVILSVARPIAR